MTISRSPHLLLVCAASAIAAAMCSVTRADTLPYDGTVLTYAGFVSPSVARPIPTSVPPATTIVTNLAVPTPAASWSGLLLASGLAALRARRAKRA